ncbi:M48 family metallopeptidase [Litorisediminicola beolgyonensis]|uniref:M48 family metallopeptidase n=1 Tax=Litorisediminicola beolgyonensis TaxID=1173614 RepID=A0ABW3ZG18_9RHOB
MSPRRLFLLLPLLAALASCGPVVVETRQTPVPAPAPAPAPERPPQISPKAERRAEAAARMFVEVIERVEPVAEQQCRQVGRAANCNFLIAVDDRPGQAPNAFQTLDAAGRPVLAFNLALIMSVDNADELAFVMGHEASHHILGHLQRAQQNAQVGAVIATGLASVAGVGDEVVRSAQQYGAALGARSYSKDFELEADQMGTIVTYRAGYNPARGAEFFNRIPDPGNRFLGTHPPNSARVDIVRRTYREISGGS